MIKKITGKSLLQKFVQIESWGGILLILTTLIALFWANSPFSEHYENLWNYNLGVRLEGFELNKPLLLWINDGLMTIFFFLIGLEIKREVLIGELNTLKKLSFPLFGALGGMLIPVAFFLVLNQNDDTFKGWGIPMATDIAFSLAILNALGSRVPLSLKVFLTAFAIVDDLGAVLVIAAFYSGSVNLAMIAWAFGLLFFLYFLSYKGYFSKFIMISLGVVIWILFLKSGVHPTLAGVLLAFSVPIGQNINTSEFLENLTTITSNIKNAVISQKPILSSEQIQQIEDLQDWTERYQSPLQNMEHSLHGWVAYLIIPLFALANAGINIISTTNMDTGLILNIVICLVLGKSIGVTTTVFLAKKLGLTEIPEDISMSHIIGASFLAGIGFTMAIFVSNLAFDGDVIFNLSSKMGILIGSFVAAAIGYLVLRFNRTKDI
ncbi:Na+/H+ antiporter NhaA [Flavimarina sp. Hel_I_48]|uniref:Na+/H+ antiporter NhaA n=1 Tax=Flavimarina sp. Hel_I_48 TaxID=1392488 RepID=UPI0004DEDFFE|nr:Na+/H+ antiporter NhaA [Flavimarina sp. Hel_I_48]